MGHVSLLVLAALLIGAVWADSRNHRIPNVISLGGIALGLTLQLWFNGLSGLLSGLGGTAVGLTMLLPFYIVKGMGAGDVKLMAAVGTFLGPVNVMLAVAFTLGVGALMALVILVVHTGLLRALSRYWATLRCLVCTLQLTYIRPAPDEAAAMRFPYAIAIASGTALSIWWLASPSSRLPLLQVI
jgi:prepilin peptidase CpaA